MRVVFDQVTKEFIRNVRVNDEVSLEVASGEVFALLGPNGAGKSTLVNQLIGLVKPTSGSIVVSGIDAAASPGAARRVCSYQPQSQVPINGLTLLEAVTLAAKIRGLKGREASLRARQLISRLHLQEWERTPGERLSGGIRRLAAFCMTCAAPSQAVILDEPTNDVDPERRRLLWEEIRSVASGGAAVLLVTHNVQEAEQSSDRLGIMYNGRMLHQGTAASFRKHLPGYMLLELMLVPGARLDGYSDRVTLQAGRRAVIGLDPEEMAEMVRWAEGQRTAGTIEEYAVKPPSLEEAYLRLTVEPASGGAA